MGGSMIGIAKEDGCAFEALRVAGTTEADDAG